MYVITKIMNNVTKQHEVALFLVAFQHDYPTKNKPRKCQCDIWYCSTLTAYALKQSYPNNKVIPCQSKTHPEIRSRMLLCSSYSVCSKEDQYVKAFGRFMSMTRALRYLSTECYLYENIDDVSMIQPFLFKDKNIKTFIRYLSEECFHGKQTAIKMMKEIPRKYRM